jgi:hypothetical protein
MGFLLVVLACLAGCGGRDECDNDTCSGNTLLECSHCDSEELSCRRTITPRACGAAAACVTPSQGEGQAFCSESAQREPRCQGTHGFCDDDGKLVTCVGGYIYAREPCPKARSGATACVSLPDDALCALSPEPDPRCPATNPDHFAGPPYVSLWCDPSGQEARLFCNRGFLTDIDDRDSWPCDASVALDGESSAMPSEDSDAGTM